MSQLLANRVSSGIIKSITEGAPQAEVDQANAPVEQPQGQVAGPDRPPRLPRQNVRSQSVITGIQVVAILAALIVTVGLVLRWRKPARRQRFDGSEARLIESIPEGMDGTRNVAMYPYAPHRVPGYGIYLPQHGVVFPSVPPSHE